MEYKELLLIVLQCFEYIAFMIIDLTFQPPKYFAKNYLKMYCFHKVGCNSFFSRRGKQLFYKVIKTFIWPSAYSVKGKHCCHFYSLQKVNWWLLPPVLKSFVALPLCKIFFRWHHWEVLTNSITKEARLRNVI